MQRLEQILEAVRTLLHVEAVEAKVFSLRSGRVVLAHPVYQAFHFFGAIDGKAGGGEGLRGRACFAVNVPVDRLAGAGICLQRKGPHAVFLSLNLQYIEPQLLKFPVSVRRLAQRDDLRFIGNGQRRNIDGVF